MVTVGGVRADRLSPLSLHFPTSLLRALRASALAALCLTGSVLVPAGRASAQATSTTAPTSSTVADPNAPTTSSSTTTSLPPLAPPNADAAAAARAQVEVRAAELALRQAKAAEKKTAKGIAPTEKVVAAAQARVDELAAAERAAADRLAQAKGRMRDMAVGSYVVGGDVRAVNFLLDTATADDLYRRRAVVQEATSSKRRVVDEHAAAVSAANGEVQKAVAALDGAKAQQAAAHKVHADAVEQVRLRQAELDDKKLFVDLVRAGAPVGQTDIPRLVLDAYQKATAAMTRTAPGCGLRWTMLAGIGRIESNHGRFRGSSITLHGEVLPYIIGVALDGSGPVALISDTDGGSYDGDTVYDRAVGPMQFIPSTWAFSKRDANGDGFYSPHNIYDASLAAAAYLCRAADGKSMQTEEGFHAAVWSYNHSESYIAAVRAGMDRFEDQLAGVPNLKGSLPGVRLPKPPPPPPESTTTTAPAPPPGGGPTGA